MEPAKPSDASPPPTPARAELEARGALYKVAYEEAKRALDDQVKELSDVRQRAVQFMAFVGSATAFLVGTRFSGGDKSGWFYVTASMATLLALTMIVSGVLLLAPSFVRWSFRVSADRVIYRLIEKDLSREVPGPPSEGELHRKLALRYEQKRLDNEKSLTRVRRAYFISISAGSLQLALWTALVWWA